ncbi:MAG: YgiT-type zinc finger protein [Candidatus Diapherotrites archaeon]|uniref:YgiT-type zinc finger protein n=2 Tax=Candidatus Iainarchaeum sp. TaxID=3101447 RepID=A0A8T4L920_9ARCH|nr:YgiT-type zinc finger protein [Candidatus Diapherotrites archaeon]
MAENSKITCHLCGGMAKLRVRDLKLADEKITIKGSPYYKCRKCGEEFATGKQMQELSDLINQKFSFRRPVISAGRSLAITLPKDLAEYCELKQGSKVRLVPESKKKIELIIG